MGIGSVSGRRLSLSVVLFLTALGLGAWGCGSDRREWAVVEEPSLGGDAGTPSEPEDCSGLRCSLDLHSIVKGCDEQVVATCQPGQGCARGECVSACESAEASQGSRGCSFMTVPPPQLAESSGSCFAAFVANTWNEPAEISVFYKGEKKDVSHSMVVPHSSGKVTYQPLTGPLPPGGVAVVFLAQAPSGTNNFVRCPGEATVQAAGSLEGTGRLDAFEIKASVPVSAYSIYPYGGATSFLPSATLLLPTASWGKGYRLLDAWAGSRIELAPSIQVVAAEDDTEVRVMPTANIAGGPAVAPAAAGVETSWRLRKGEVVQIVQSGRLLGSPLTSSKPVAVFGGANCTFLPESQGACDSLQQQIPPQSAWGVEYAAVRYRARTGDEEESSPWRIIAAADGTQLRYDPEPPEGAPTELRAGQSAVFWTGRPFVVTSQDTKHPIFVNGYMTGGVAFSGIGDPDFVNVVPTDQFLNEYVFFSDHTYAEGTLNFVRTKTATGFHDVTLDCAGVLEGWRPLGTSGRYEYVRVDLVRGNAPQKYGSGTCSHGRREAHSKGPFGLTVWGFDLYASYAYPGGSGTRTINTAPVR